MSWEQAFHKNVLNSNLFHKDVYCYLWFWKPLHVSEINFYFIPFWYNKADAGVGRKSPDLFWGGIAIPRADTHLATISIISRKRRVFTRQPTMTEGRTSCVVTHQIVEGEA